MIETNDTSRNDRSLWIVLLVNAFFVLAYLVVTSLLLARAFQLNSDVQLILTRDSKERERLAGIVENHADELSKRYTETTDEIIKEFQAFCSTAKEQHKTAVNATVARLEGIDTRLRALEKGK